MDKTEAYERAEKAVEARFEFYRHLAIYVAVNVLLVVINLLTSPETLWFIWALLGWGIAIVVHAIQVFFLPSESSFKARMIEKELEKQSTTDE